MSVYFLRILIDQMYFAKVQNVSFLIGGGRNVDQIELQPGVMIVRSVEIDKDLPIVLIFLCRDSLDWPSGQTRALVTPS